jgi:hypothetical protein
MRIINKVEAVISSTDLATYLTSKSSHELCMLNGPRRSSSSAPIEHCPHCPHYESSKTLLKFTGPYYNSTTTDLLFLPAKLSARHRIQHKEGQSTLGTGESCHRIIQDSRRKKPWPSARQRHRPMSLGVATLPKALYMALASNRLITPDYILDYTVFLRS